jgi:hypothetical protein
MTLPRASLAGGHKNYQSIVTTLMRNIRAPKGARMVFIGLSGDRNGLLL